MYNLFCLATELGTFEVRVFGDQHVEAWLDGTQIEVEGAAGFGPSPTSATPHTVFEFVLARLPSKIRVLECDPAGGTIEVPALPPDVRLASQGGCFPGSAPAVPHNLVREPTVFDIELGPEGVRRATATSAPLLLGVDARSVVTGDELTVFGAQLGASTAVRFGDVEVAPSSSDDESVTVLVPDIDGRVALTVIRDGRESNALSIGVQRCECDEGFECDESRTCVPLTLD